MPLPSSTLLLLIPMTLLGLGLPITPNGFVGLPANCLVGLRPPAVNCLMSAASDPPSPVNCRASVVVPVYCVDMREGRLLDPNGAPLRVPILDGANSAVVLVGDPTGEAFKPEGRSDLEPTISCMTVFTMNQRQTHQTLSTPNTSLSVAFRRTVKFLAASRLFVVFSSSLPVCSIFPTAD